MGLLTIMLLRPRRRRGESPPQTLFSLVAERRNRPELFDPCKEILDLVSPLVHLTLIITGLRPVPLRRNHRRCSVSFNFLKKPLSIVCLVPYQGSEPEILKRFRHPSKMIMRLAGKDHKPHKVSKRIQDCHGLAGQAAPGASDPLPAGSPFAPAAFRCAWTIVPSTKTYSRSNSSNDSLKTRFEDTRNSPAAEPLEHAIPVVETLRKVAPGRSRPGPPKHGLKKLPIVRCSGAGIGRLAGQHGLDPLPNAVGQYRPVCIHKVVHERRLDQQRSQPSG